MRRMASHTESLGWRTDGSRAVEAQSLECYCRSCYGAYRPMGHGMHAGSIRQLMPHGGHRESLADAPSWGNQLTERARPAESGGLATMPVAQRRNDKPAVSRIAAACAKVQMGQLRERRLSSRQSAAWRNPDNDTSTADVTQRPNLPLYLIPLARYLQNTQWFLLPFSSTLHAATTGSQTKEDPMPTNKRITFLSLPCCLLDTATLKALPDNATRPGRGTAALHLVLEEDLQKTATGHSQTRSVAEWMQHA
ncbi:hypothetical protein TRIATDRAFT_89527 [Trichoderma atroviride IMI 206040]|uniref:Uncharacterized protein n=1 Tax=Hypocrea atroviridis (strain ATCC 20476 / IMI 206040) TaxID=452589 RepID=G9P9S7_HYPAI|nr:uncharacterized protein TRIATDRAFT_89527 [Trichoderma atroviride IMI 206040]EHK40399.1 hypothetical protein TRIATDRAFT_89527 [Trichoderma atroviride IMI 206040]